MKYIVEYRREGRIVYAASISAMAHGELMRQIMHVKPNKDLKYQVEIYSADDPVLAIDTIEEI